MILSQEIERVTDWGAKVWQNKTNEMVNINLSRVIIVLTFFVADL